jgi:RHS repeat-associated protein
VKKTMNLSSKLRSIAVLGLALGLSLLLCQRLDTVKASPLLRVAQFSDARIGLRPVGRAATLLPNGKLLLTGGEDSTGVLATAAIQDPQSGVTTPLASGLLHARAWHTATLLPDGTVLVFGGENGAKSLVPRAEIFDPASDRSRELPLTGLSVRAHHTATLLTDGRVLLVGGIDSTGELLPSLQTWDSRSGSIQSLSTILIAPRKDHTAALAPNGGVLFWGGTAKSGLALDYGELFDPLAEAERIATNADSLKPDRAEPFVEASLPADGATDVPLNALIAVRFSKALAVQSVTADTVSLSANGVAVAAKVVPSEGGMLAFISPTASLASGTTYTLSVNGAKDPSGNQIDLSNISFTTAGSPVSASGGNEDDERGPLDNTAFRLPPLQAPKGETALAGQVLKLNGKPLAHVLLQIDNRRTYSDGTGRFLLRNVTPGHHAMLIDGATANHGSIAYGIYDDGVDVQTGVTNVLNYTIWMTPLDLKHEVTIPSPTLSEFIVTNPLLPGLELHLPPNTVIKDRNGKVVTRISITPIPVSQPPFPLPQGVEVPIYFTIQPGGAYLDMPAGSWGKGAQLWYPNWHNAPPGTIFDFWNYDPDAKGWYVYGEGHVSPNGHNVIPDPGVEIYQFTGAMAGSPGAAPLNGSPAGDHSHGGDPVNLSTGLFVYNKTDLVLPDVIPLTLQRTYRPQDNQSRPFGIGTTDSFELFMVGDTNPYTYFDLILPDGSRIHFYRTSSGTGYADAVYAHTSAGTSWYGASIAWNPSAFPGGAWVLTTKNQTKYFFPDGYTQTNPAKMALLGIRDRYGNTVTITRDSSGNKTQVTSPNGRYITFQHDASNRITQAQDNIGRTVQYQYDAVGRLQQVTDAAGGVWLYTYDSNNNMLTIQDARGIVYLTNQYDSGNHVIKQTQADGSTYQFAWTFTSNAAQPPYFFTGSLPPGGSPTAILGFRTCTTCGEGYHPLVTQVDVTDPNGYVKRVQFGPTGYTTSTTYALGRPEQQTYTYSYYADNLLQSVTDSMGRVTSYTYDANENLLSITHLSGTPNAVTTTMTYDGTFNQLLSVTDPLNNATNFGYDTSGNLVTITDPLQHQTSMTYDAEGRVLSSTDPMSDRTTFNYFLADLVSVTDPLSRTTVRTTDAAGRVVSITDPMGHVTRMAYNALNQVTSTTDALGNVTSLAYDPNGNLLTVTDANQHTTTYTYGNMDRAQTRTDPLLRQESYTYDLNGNLSTYTDRRGKVTSFSYDGLNRRTFAGFGTIVNGGSTTYESTIAYTYDSGNRVTQAADSIAGNVTPGYDLLDRRTSEATPQGSISYTYDAANRRATMTVAGQPQVTYTYDTASRLTQIAQGTNTVGLSYDNANRRTSLTLPNGVVTSYNYDNGSELTGLTYQIGANTLGTLTYGYDLAGRRTQVGGTFARTGLPAAMGAASYDAANELTNWNGLALSYDSNGNMLSDGSNAFTWNARNQVASLNGVNLQYDAFGRRTTNAAATSFLYDGANAAQELSGSTVTANLVSGGTDEIFSRTDASGSFTPLKDALGSAIALVDSSGNVQTSYTYEPFGNTSVSGASNGNKFQYTGRENEGNRLYYYRARYYNPTIGRFISQDPIGFRGGTTNLYSYTMNSPTNLRDPDGRNPFCVVGALAGTMVFNWDVIQQSVNGRKAAYYAGWEGLERIAIGNAEYAIAGCMISYGAGAAAGWTGVSTVAAGTTAAVAATGINGIDISQQGLEHVLDGHLAGGIDAAVNSIFVGDAQTVVNLIQTSQTAAPIIQGNGNSALVNYTSQVVGYSATGQYTTVYTVIVNSSSGLVTAFPGVPGRP